MKSKLEELSLSARISMDTRCSGVQWFLDARVHTVSFQVMKTYILRPIIRTQSIRYFCLHAVCFKYCSIRFISGVTLVACSIVSFSRLTLLFLFLHFQSVPEAPLNRFDKRERRDIKGFKFSICRNIKTSLTIG